MKDPIKFPVPKPVPDPVVMAIGTIFEHFSHHEGEVLFNEHEGMFLVLTKGKSVAELKKVLVGLGAFK